MPVGQEGLTASLNNAQYGTRSGVGTSAFVYKNERPLLADTVEKVESCIGSNF